MAKVIVRGSIYSDDMTSLTGWAGADVGTGVSDLITFQGKTCQRHSAGASGYTVRTKDIGSFGAQNCYSLCTYVHNVGAGVYNRFGITFSNGSYDASFGWQSNGLFIRNAGTNETQIGSSLVVVDTWQDWVFDINWTGKTAVVYLNGQLNATGVDFSARGSATANGTVEIVALQDGNIVGYIDYLNIGTSFNFSVPAIIIY